ncbi:pyrroline-5-carboxylate reductase [Limnohabitans sp. Rim11]|uniref:pyrroline-5-carboxylate reductase n=1 Tax=Limnohabitans sp. Rim11 TaxID=1100719 RepID=UPI000B0328DB|nr:pyrroline-5-carboxylate reductase [Limnohabitans sp. Rim11]
MTTPASTDLQKAHLAFIGGGNMASAILGGLIRQGFAPAQVTVIEPFTETAAKLTADWGVEVATAAASASTALSKADLVIWAVKPQVFKEAALPVAAFTQKALHLSVAAGIRSDSIARWLQTDRVVRSMPNTPALVGQGITGLFARAGVSAPDQHLIEQVLKSTGEFLWVQQEADLDTVTALSGSGPAYVFYFLEAMTEAGVKMGLPEAQAYHLAKATFGGATHLARQSVESPEVLRQRVTSKGGTTYAALTSMADDHVKEAFVKGMLAAQKRASELGDEFGKD